MNKSNNKFVLPILLVGIVLLSMGCISIEYKQVQHPDGSASVSETIDFTKYFETMSNYMNSNMSNHVNLEQEKEKTLKGVCENVTNEDIDCTYNLNDNTVTVHKNYPKNDHFYDFNVKKELTKKTYTLIIDQLPAFVKDNKVKVQKLSEGYGNSSTNIEYMKTMGLKMEYTIEMPGKITYANGGEISKDKKSVKYDLLTMFDEKKPIEVKSEETGLFCLPSTALLLGILGFALFKL